MAFTIVFKLQSSTSRCSFLRINVNWVIPEKIHTSPTDGTLEILAGGGSRALEIQVGGGI